MVIRVIQNKAENHFGEVKDLLANSNKALIASPFVSLTVIDKMKNWLTFGFQELTLITTLKEKDPDQLRKVPVLMELFRLKKTRGFHLTVKIDNQLHGKVYIGKRDSNYTGAIVTSANFTENGLENNHEWGFYVNDQNVISDIHHQILEDATVKLAEKDLMKMKQWMEENQAEDVKSPTVDVSFVDMIERPIPERPVSNIGGVTYWLKPLGRDHKPVPETAFYGETKHIITFSKRGRPTGVKEGDILIAYSIGTMQLISVFVAGNDDDRGELTKFPIPGDDKWPYYIWCKNETSQYGASWFKRKLSLHSLRDEFLRCQPTSTVLPSGNKLNALQWGADHVRATLEFGLFVVRKMKDVEGEADI
jgi:hypothetical protein